MHKITLSGLSILFFILRFACKFTIYGSLTHLTNNADIYFSACFGEDYCPHLKLGKSSKSARELLKSNIEQKRPNLFFVCVAQSRKCNVSQKACSKSKTTYDQLELANISGAFKINPGTISSDFSAELARNTVQDFKTAFYLPLELKIEGGNQLVLYVEAVEIESSSDKNLLVLMADQHQSRIDNTYINWFLYPIDSRNSKAALFKTLIASVGDFALYPRFSFDQANSKISGLKFVVDNDVRIGEDKISPDVLSKKADENGAVYFSLGTPGHFEWVRNIVVLETSAEWLFKKQRKFHAFKIGDAPFKIQLFFETEKEQNIRKTDCKAITDLANYDHLEVHETKINVFKKLLDMATLGSRFEKGEQQVMYCHKNKIQATAIDSIDNYECFKHETKGYFFVHNDPNKGTPPYEFYCWFDAVDGARKKILRVQVKHP